jgi:hypothetical protein
MRIALTIALAGVACAGQPRQQPVDPGHDRPLSVAEHQQEAERHERVANQEQAGLDPEQSPTGGQPMQCYDNPLVPDPSSGGETIRVLKPCWTPFTARPGEHARRAKIHREAAREHRERAADLIRAEKEACRGLGETAVAVSPFFYREDVIAATPYYEDGELRGARATFRKVPGLSVDWLRRAVACHQARAGVLGYSSTYARYCPLMVGELATSVDETDAGFVVTMRSDDRDVAAAVLGRVEDLTGGE